MNSVNLLIKTEVQMMDRVALARHRGAGEGRKYPGKWLKVEYLEERLWMVSRESLKQKSHEVAAKAGYLKMWR